MASAEEVNRTTFGAKTEVVVVHELGGSEAVVKLNEVEIFWSDTGLLITLLCSELCESVHVRQHLAGIFVWVGCENRCRYLDCAALLLAFDPVVLPRLSRIDALPRDATGKLPRARLLALVAPPPRERVLRFAVEGDRATATYGY
jgi:hypothetical protein